MKKYFIKYFLLSRKGCCIYYISCFVTTSKLSVLRILSLFSAHGCSPNLGVANSIPLHNFYICKQSAICVSWLRRSSQLHYWDMFNLSNQGNARQMSRLKLMQFCKFKNCLILHSTALIVPFRQRSEYLYVGTQTKTSLDFLLEQERNKWLCCPKTNDKSNLLDLSDLKSQWR